MKTLIIGLGGFGINTVTNAHANGCIKLSDNVDVLLIDGADSNTPEDPDLAQRLKLVANVNGAGKKRSRCAKRYVEFINENISSVPEADVYILVYSLTGGSGSVLGPEMNRLLLKDNRNCINAVLLTTDSKEDLTNAYNTLHGLGKQSSKLNRPVHLMLEDGTGTPRSSIDTMMLANIESILEISSKRHAGLDPSDLRSWLDYQEHGIAPSLTMIEVFTDPEVMIELKGSVITVLSLLSDPDNVVPAVGAVFNTDGPTELDKDVHYVTTTKNMENLSEHVQAKLAEYTKAASGLNVKSVFGGSDDDDDGEMVY